MRYAERPFYGWAVAPTMCSRNPSRFAFPSMALPREQQRQRASRQAYYRLVSEHAVTGLSSKSPSSLTKSLLQRPRLPPSMIAFFHREFFDSPWLQLRTAAAWRSGAYSGRPPSIFIRGAAKCGTTWLHAFWTRSFVRFCRFIIDPGVFPLVNMNPLNLS